MNIIQVGRPAVSCYRELFLTNMSVNYDVHTFPTSQFGLKLGGFMLLEEEAAAQANVSGLCSFWEISDPGSWELSGPALPAIDKTRHLPSFIMQPTRSRSLPPGRPSKTKTSELSQ
jgi:hypothetical protein